MAGCRFDLPGTSATDVYAPDAPGQVFPLGVADYLTGNVIVPADLPPGEHVGRWAVRRVIGEAGVDRRSIARTIMTTDTVLTARFELTAPPPTTTERPAK